MTSQIRVLQIAPRQWEVRANDPHCKPLGIFYDEATRDLFIEALEAILLPGDEGGSAEGPSRKVAPVAA